MAEVVPLRDADANDDANDDDERFVSATLAELSKAIPDPPPTLRVVVGVLGFLQLLVVVPWLVGYDPLGLLGDSPGAHRTRDGALGLSVGIAALLAAWRPRWAQPCFAIAVCGVIAQLLAGIIDRTVATGGNELIHLPVALLAALIGLLSVRLRPLGPPDGPPQRR
ncbi:MAG: hypothetical protein ACK5OX_05815 [Desertimonas sp.]